jgi:hypothetical protein
LKKGDFAQITRDRNWYPETNAIDTDFLAAGTTFEILMVSNDGDEITQARCLKNNRTYHGLGYIHPQWKKI